MDASVDALAVQESSETGGRASLGLMAVIILTMRVRREDAPAVVDVVSSLGGQARHVDEPDAPTALVIGESLILDDGVQAAEHDLVERLETTLRRQNITADILGHGVHDSSFTTSRFTVRAIGAGEEDEEPLVIFAEDRAEFIERLTALRTLFRDEPGPPADLAGYEVTVEGLAASEPDVQRPPFRASSSD